MNSGNQHIEVPKSEEEDFGPDDLDDHDMVSNMLPHNIAARYDDEAPLTPLRTGRNQYFAEGQPHEQLQNFSQESEPNVKSKNSNKQGINLKDEALDSIHLESLIQLLRYRIKNNSLGQIHYLPDEWNGKIDS
jgi:hypothetical protein